MRRCPPELLASTAVCTPLLPASECLVQLVRGQLCLFVVGSCTVRSPPCRQSMRLLTRRQPAPLLASVRAPWSCRDCFVSVRAAPQRTMHPASAFHVEGSTQRPIMHIILHVARIVLNAHALALLATLARRRRYALGDRRLRSVICCATAHVG